MQSSSDNLVIIPVLNERGTIATVLENIRAHHTGDILAIDDGSTDGSEMILDNTSGIQIIRHGNNLGYGKSLIDGFSFAIRCGYKLVLTIDCDEQHEPNLIPNMFAGIGDHDVLSGSRYLGSLNDDDTPPADRYNINMIITDIINEITRLCITDSFCGFKCYRVSALARLSLDEPGFAQPLQFWIQAKRHGLKVAEIAVPRIYKNLNRSFGEKLDNPNTRVEYYLDVIVKELERVKIPIPEHMVYIAKHKLGKVKLR